MSSTEKRANRLLRIDRESRGKERAKREVSYLADPEEIPESDNFAGYAKEQLRGLTEQVIRYKPDPHQKTKAKIEKASLLGQIESVTRTLRM